MYTSILLAYDGSEHAKRALNAAIELAKLTPNAQLKIVHVVRFDHFEEGVFSQMTGMVSRAEYRELMLKEGEKILSEAQTVAEASGLTPTYEVLQGDPARAIADFAEAHQIDLIIMGRRGLNALQELFIGSVSHRVLQLAKCAVLIVK